MRPRYEVECFVYGERDERNRVQELEAIISRKWSVSGMRRTLNLKNKPLQYAIFKSARTLI